MSEHRSIRVLTLPERQDKFLSRMGDEIAMDVPGGRVTLALNGGWSESGTAFCHLTFKPIRQGLVRFGAGPGHAADGHGTTLPGPTEAA